MQSLETRNPDPEMSSAPPIAAGMSVAKLYHIQPLLVDIARRFSISECVVGIAATVAQLGYALGLLLIVPLGDAIERRKRILYSSKFFQC